MEYDPTLAALLAQPWSNNVCRGYVHLCDGKLSCFPTNPKCKGGFTVKLTAQELEQMKSVDIGAVSADALADVSGMAFDRTLPREERLARFVKRAVNPYCFSVGGVGVKIEFAEGGPSLQDTLTAFLIRQKSGL